MTPIPVVLNPQPVGQILLTESYHLACRLPTDLAAEEWGVPGLAHWIRYLIPAQSWAGAALALKVKSQHVEAISGPMAAVLAH